MTPFNKRSISFGLLRGWSHRWHMNEPTSSGSRTGKASREALMARTVRGRKSSQFGEINVRLIVLLALIIATRPDC